MSDYGIGRDFALARLAEVRAHVVALKDDLDETLSHFIDPTDDMKKRRRKELVDGMIDEAGMISRTLEALQENGFNFRDVELDDEEEDEEGVDRD